MKSKAETIRILIADGDTDARDFIHRVLDQEANFIVIGKSGDGDETVRLAERMEPDVIVLSVNMAGEDVARVTRKILDIKPAPVIITGSRRSPKEVVEMFRAIRAGAVAAVDHPAESENGGRTPKIEKMVSAINMIVRIDVENRLRLKRRPPENGENRYKETHNGSNRIDQIPDKELRDIRVIAIGASTGGPPVIRAILSGLKPGFNIPILIVQHISPGFVNGMAKWLTSDTLLRIVIPKHRDPICKSHVYFAPDSMHMGVNGRGEILLARGPNINGVKPSASYLFSSVADSFPGRAAGVLLTGMGVDGAVELGKIKAKGGLTIAQSKDSSVIFGMPGEAVRLNTARYVLAPPKIVELLNRFHHNKYDL